MLVLLLILGLGTLGLYIVLGIEITIGGRSLIQLEDVPPIDHAEAPRISVVIPACNEERNIESALTSVLAQDYPDFEVIVLDDRSLDATGAILDRMAETNPRLRVIHIRELPPGWLGKNHALQGGASRATGTILLFTDADVVLEASVLRRAAQYMLANDLDHLTVTPRIQVGGWAAKSFVALFAVAFTLYVKPWKVKDPDSARHVGIGAFNMVRSAAYWGAEGHAPIAMRPDDDMKLGKLLKLRGYRQDIVNGTRLLLVEWYSSFAEMRRGLMKNLFAGAEYRVWMILLSSIGQVLCFVWPFVALVCTRGWVQVVNGLIILILMGMFRINSGRAGINPWWGLTIPVAALICVYLLLRATVLTLMNGGIEWRGTHYQLSRLRANRI